MTVLPSYANSMHSCVTTLMHRFQATTARAQCDAMRCDASRSVRLPRELTGSFSDLAEQVLLPLDRRQLRHRQRQPLDAVAREVDLRPRIVPAALQRQHRALAELVVEDLHA